jgi:hypothetical protein
MVWIKEGLGLFIHQGVEEGSSYSRALNIIQKRNSP